MLSSKTLNRPALKNHLENENTSLRSQDRETMNKQSECPIENVSESVIKQCNVKIEGVIDAYIDSNVGELDHKPVDFFERNTPLT